MEEPCCLLYIQLSYTLQTSLHYFKKLLLWNLFLEIPGFSPYQIHLKSLLLISFPQVLAVSDFILTLNFPWAISVIYNLSLTYQKLHSSWFDISSNYICNSLLEDHSWDDVAATQNQHVKNWTCYLTSKTSSFNPKRMDVCMTHRAVQQNLTQYCTINYNPIKINFKNNTSSFF